MGVATVGALRAGGSASGDADRSKSARARAGDEVEVCGGKHKKGQGARLGESPRRPNSVNSIGILCHSVTNPIPA